MKYNFVYDTDFITENCVELSAAEKILVVLIVVGGYNAIVYGYKPERITDTVKKVSTTWEELTTPISTTLTIDGNQKVYVSKFCEESVIHSQTLVYKCKENDIKASYFISRINKEVSYTWKKHGDRTCCKDKDAVASIQSFGNLITTTADNHIDIFVAGSTRPIEREFVYRVSRTVADMRGHGFIRSEDVLSASDFV